VEMRAGRAAGGADVSDDAPAFPPASRHARMPCVSGCRDEDIGLPQPPLRLRAVPSAVAWT
jgi:hypothetical protein